MSLSFRNAVLKNDARIVDQVRENLLKEGMRNTLTKVLRFSWDIVRRFFREYLPLCFFLLLTRKNGEIERGIQGSRMILNINDEGISRELLLYGVHEKNSTAEVKRIISPGMNILEVGANIGYYALLEAKLAGPTGFLYGFEPSPFNIDLLRRNLELNHIENYEVYGMAAGAENQTGKFFVANKSNLSSFIQREGMDMVHDGKIIDVKVVRLDNFFAEKKLDFIRMDVEGYELEILKGAEELLKRPVPPKHFFIEVHSELLHKKDSSAREIIEYLGQYGYQVTKSFYRGNSKVVASSTEELLSHPLLEKGYWETFFEHRG
jgi:FkbM family methyltransferase